MTDEKQKHKLTEIWIWVVVGSVATIVCGIVAFYFRHFSQQLKMPLSNETDNWGQFGDYVGGLANPLVSLATLLVVASAYLLQRRELSETTRALAESAKAQAEQTQLSNIQGQINVATAHLNMHLQLIGNYHAEIRRLASCESWPILSNRGLELTSRQACIEEIGNFLPETKRTSDQIIATSKLLEKLMVQLQTESQKKT